MGRHKIEMILVVADGSEQSVKAARYAAELARSIQPRITVVHVVPAPVVPQDVGQLGAEGELDAEKAAWESAEAVLDGASQPFDEVGMAVERIIRRGDVASEVLSLAREEEFDLIVVAGREGGRAKKAVGASATDAVVRAAPCPVLVYRDP